MPSSGQRRKGPDPLTASVRYTEAAEATGPGDLRVPPHPARLTVRACGPVILPRAAARGHLPGVRQLFVEGCGDAMIGLREILLRIQGRTPERLAPGDVFQHNFLLRVE
jgi:hypothetical protein